MAEDDGQFFDAKSPASKTKIAIVTKYFATWAKILGPISVRLAYQDLYCGPGRYENGEASTPVLIVEHIIADPKLREKVETYFNDEDPEHTECLKKNLMELPGYETLRHEPLITAQTVDRGFEEQLRHIGRVPTFSFVDPFGYKGITLKLLQRMLGGFGCDLVLFFNYNRIRAALTNDNVEHHVVGLFGNEKRVGELKRKLAGKSTGQREVIILDTFAQALKEMGFKYVHPFTFMQADRSRVSHHLIFVTKNYRGYEVMKDITASESSSDEEGVPSFGYAPPLSKEVTPLLFEFARPLEQLGAMLMDEYAGQTITFEELFEEHNVGRRYIRRNYRQVLKQMEADSRISTERAPGAPKRRKNTFPDDLIITFPAKEKR